MQGKPRKMGDELAVANKATGEVISTVLRVQVEGNCYSSVMDQINTHTHYLNRQILSFLYSMWEKKEYGGGCQLFSFSSSMVHNPHLQSI